MYKLLIVDDVQAELDVMSFLIKKHNLPFEISSASNGRDALMLLKRNCYNLLITDIKMPFMDGLELSQKVVQAYPATKIIIMSGYQDFGYAKTAIRLGIKEYILKPIDAKEVVSLLENIHAEIDAEQLRLKAELLRTKYSTKELLLRILQNELLPDQSGLFAPEIREMFPSGKELLLLTVKQSDFAILQSCCQEISFMLSKHFNCNVNTIPLPSRWNMYLLDCESFSNPIMQGQLLEFLRHIEQKMQITLFYAVNTIPTPECLQASIKQLQKSVASVSIEPTENNESDGLSTETTSYRISIIQEYIKNHYYEDLSVNMLAELIYVHPDYLSRIFKKEVGVNLNRKLQ